jgi:hypothetical protein
MEQSIKVLNYHNQISPVMVNSCYMLIPHILMATHITSKIGFLKLTIKHAVYISQI